MPAAINLTGKKSGKLTILEFVGSKIRYGKKMRHWRCECECGNVGEYTTERLTQTGKYVSCGCERKRKFVALTKAVFG